MSEKFIESKKKIDTKEENKKTKSTSNQTVRLQDGELQEMKDEGMCLSMHQPWASLLVAGIKMYARMRLNIFC